MPSFDQPDTASTAFRSFGRGARGEKVSVVRARLVGLGLLRQDQSPGGTAGEDEYDGGVELGVRQFQQARGLTVDGIIGPETFRALEEARWRLGDRVLFYSPGKSMAGDDVGALQRRLLELGFDCGKPDGVFGGQTSAALRDFQRNTGLPADGTCGPGTFKALSRLVRTVVGGRAHAMRESARLYRNGHQHTGRLVVIDPGHGPADPGGTWDGLTESELVFDVASRLEGRLTALGVQAFLTHGHDRDAGDQARASFANEADADLVVSLHVDAHTNAAACGAAVFFYGNPGTGQHSVYGERFALLVQKELVARTDLRDCGVHPKTWDMLRMTKMPTVRAEVGYLTNPGDRERLRAPEFRDTVAEAVCAAVQRLFLPPDDDAATGTLDIPAIMAEG